MLSKIGQRVIQAVSFLRAHGASDLYRELRHRVLTQYHERRLGVHTSTTVRLSEIGITRSDAGDSAPIGYVAFFSMMQRIPVDIPQSVFLDYGVGKGRVACAAATFPFKRVIGVDISSVLLDMARANVAKMRHRRATEVDLMQADAVEFDIPPDVNVIYFYNPFRGETLRKVVGNIQDSCRRHPRMVYVVFFNNDHFDKIVEGESWIVKTAQTSFYPRTSCGLYEVRARRGN